jgi:hypothetical protein
VFVSLSVEFFSFTITFPKMHQFFSEKNGISGFAKIRNSLVNDNSSETASIGIGISMWEYLS